MRWDTVLVAIATRAANDVSLAAIYGTAIRKHGVHAFTVPSLEYMLVASSVNELWEPHLIQFSQWTSSMTDLSTSDRRLRQLFDHELPVVIEGIPMWSFYEDGGELTGPEREGYYGMASRFRFTPIRDRLLPGRGS